MAAPARGSAALAVATVPERAPAPRPGRARHLQVVDGRHRAAAARHRRARIGLTVGSILAVLVVFGLVYLHVLSAQKQFQLNSLTTTYQRAAATYDTDRVAAEEANSPASIMAEARRLGMRAPAGVTYLPTYGSGSASSAEPTPAPATGAEAPAGIADWPAMQRDLVGAP